MLSCPYCGYDLVGIAQPDAPGRCPECGRLSSLARPVEPWWVSKPERFAGAVFGLGLGAVVLDFVYRQPLGPHRWLAPALAIVVAEVWLLMLALRLRKQWGRNTLRVVSKTRFAITALTIPVLVFVAFYVVPYMLLIAVFFLYKQG